MGAGLPARPQRKTMAMTFPLGQTMATPGALDALKEVGLAPADLLDRHAAGDWGEMSDHDLAHE